MNRPIDRERFAEDEAGATLVEFALLAPALIALLLGLFDLGFNMYTKTQLEGAIQDAARSSTIEDAAANKNQIDGKVAAAVQRIAGNATVTFDRRAYRNFSEIDQLENFTDINDNGRCDQGEPFEDTNASGTWDRDRGINSTGGSRDAVLYTVNVSYPRAFPVGGLLGLPDTQTVESVTVLRNQPYGLQRTGAVLNCV